MKNFKELKIWQQRIEIVKEVFKLTECLPTTEKYGIISQMTRAAISVPANIAEGSSRNRDKDYARFLHIAFGSAFELQTYLILIKEMKWVASSVEELELLLELEIKMIHGLIRAISQKPSAKN